MNKFVKRVLTFLVVFEHCRCVEDLLANVVDVVRNGVLGNLVGASSAVVHDKLSYHSEVLVKGMLFVGQRLEVKRRFAREDVADLRHFTCKSARQNKQSHHFDYADGLLLDIVEFGSRMEDSVGVFVVGSVVAQYQIELIFAVVVD